MFQVVVTDHGFEDLNRERAILNAAGATLVETQCRTEDDVIEAARMADGLLVQWAPLSARVLEHLRRCRVIVRYGVGVEGIDVAAATKLGIPVCNVPDYCSEEVADHTMALALALVRQLPAIDRRLRGGRWQVTPDQSMPACGDMLFATAGYGRTGRAVLSRAKAFRFHVAAYDPFVAAGTLEGDGVTRLDLDRMFTEADVLSLHLPLTDETRHLVNHDRLRLMKPTAILVNTARGALVDTIALADALYGRTIAFAGLDVFEEEPPPPDHPLFQCDNTLLTSHVAWYSERSLPTLQEHAAREIVRGLRGEPLRNPLNHVARAGAPND